MLTRLPDATGGYPGVSAYDDVVAYDSIGAQQSSSGVNDDIVSDSWVAFPSFDYVTFLVSWEAQCAQGDTLVDFDVVAYLRGFSYDNARSMVNEEVLADSGSRVDVYARLRVHMFAHNSWDQWNATHVKFVSNSVSGYRQYTRVAQMTSSALTAAGSPSKAACISPLSPSRISGSFSRSSFTTC